MKIAYNLETLKAFPEELIKYVEQLAGENVKDLDDFYGIFGGSMYLLDSFDQGGILFKNGEYYIKGIKADVVHLAYNKWLYLASFSNDAGGDSYFISII